MLKVASTCMESQDAHEYVLIIGQVGHSFDILDVGMLHKKYSLSMYIPVCTSMYWYIPILVDVCTVYTGMYWYVLSYTCIPKHACTVTAPMV